jgi:transcriptional regulator with XRE-family HTH domain
MLANRDVDAHVGKIIREKRKSIGCKATQLARHLGITPQQLDKYEHGISVIQATRLKQVADFLDVEIECFFEGLPGYVSPTVEQKSPKIDTEITDAFLRIKEKNVRNSVLTFVKSLG